MKNLQLFLFLFLLNRSFCAKSVKEKKLKKAYITFFSSSKKDSIEGLFLKKNQLTNALLEITEKKSSKWKNAHQVKKQVYAFLGIEERDQERCIFHYANLKTINKFKRYMSFDKMTRFDDKFYLHVVIKDSKKGLLQEKIKKALPPPSLQTGLRLPPGQQTKLSSSVQLNKKEKGGRIKLLSIVLLLIFIKEALHLFYKKSIQKKRKKKSPKASSSSSPPESSRSLP